MPKFTIRTPSGHEVDIDAADEALAMKGAQQWYTQNVTNKTDTSVTSALAQGASDLVSGVGKTIREYAAPEAGVAVQTAGASIANPKYRSAADEFRHPNDGAENHFLGRDWSKLPRAVVEQTPGMATDLLATLAMKRLGPIAQVASGMGAFALRSAGNEAQKRATARTDDPDAAPSVEDKTIGLASTATQAGLNQAGIGKIINPARVTGVGASGVSQAAKNVATAAVAEGVTGAAQEGVSQAASTAGTKDGLRFDPDAVLDSGIFGAASGGSMASPRGLKDAIASARFRDVGGPLEHASAAVANRLLDRVEAPQDLQSPSKGYQATSEVRADVLRELTAAASGLRKMSPLSTDAENAISRAAQGGPITDGDLRTINGLGSEADPVKGLVAQAAVVSRLTSKGNFDEGGQRFGGGMAEQARKFVTRHPLLSGGAYTGANALTTGLDMLASSVASQSLPAAAAYVGTRAAESALGITSPARTFAEKFADASVPVRMEDAPISGPPVAVGPTGPKVRSQNSITPAQPWGPVEPKLERFKPDIVEPGIRKIVEKIEKAKQTETTRELTTLLRAEGAKRHRSPAQEGEAGPRAAGNDAETSNAHDASQQQWREHAYHGLSDAEVRTKAVEDAVAAGVIPDIRSVRERYGQGVQAKRDAIRAAVNKAANSDGYTDHDVIVFSPFYDRLMHSRTRHDARMAILDATSFVSPKALQALLRHLDDKTINRIWKR